MTMWKETTSDNTYPLYENGLGRLEQKYSVPTLDADHHGRKTNSSSVEYILIN